MVDEEISRIADQGSGRLGLFVVEQQRINIVALPGIAEQQMRYNVNESERSVFVGDSLDLFLCSAGSLHSIRENAAEVLRSLLLYGIGI